MNVKYKLKHCPFCGGKDSVEVVEEEWFYVICNLLKRGCGARSFKTDDCKKDVIKAWNMRLESARD